MTTTIAIVGSKGGVTKTTIARALCVAYAGAGWNTLGADFDVGLTKLIKWVRKRIEGNIEPIFDAQVYGTPAQIKKKIAENVYDIIIMDAGAFVDRSVPELADMADIVVIPTSFSSDDLEEAATLANSLYQRGVSPEKITIVFSGVIDDEGEYLASKEYFSQTPYKIIEGYIPKTKSLSKAQDKGLSILECVYKSPRLKADHVIQGIINHVEYLTSKG